MDAAEDREVKLQRASGDLVKEFSAKLPSLLWKSGPKHNSRVPRRWTPAAKTERLVALLEPFQEWPQLLDPHLQSLLPPLVDAFLAYLLKYREEYAGAGAVANADATAAAPRDSAVHQHSAYPLPRAISRLLYTFCKVRGVKVISRFLNNEPKYLDPLLRAFIAWDADAADQTEARPWDVPRRMVWEERYVMLMWLAHLLLAPFDLAFLSSEDLVVPFGNLQQVAAGTEQTPRLARALLSLALEYVHVAGKEREAATVLLARLVLRRDMQALGLLGALVKWAFGVLLPAAAAAAGSTDSTTTPMSVYTCIGVLSFLARLAASAQVEDFAPLIMPVFQQTLRIVQGTSEVSQVIRSSASARKIVIKILRALTVMALAAGERATCALTEDEVSSILEDSIDHFLVSLADKDTPVRFAASKALSIITLKLHPEMAAEVIEAVTGSLEENILYQKPDGAIVTLLEARRIGMSSLKRNLSAVDAQRWQGLVLTLGHLLFRRAPPTTQLPAVLQPLVSGLDFEQRSSTGSSVGTGVRDAACFGIWALSRKYTTQELLALTTQTTISTPSVQGEQNTTTLQMLAIELVCAACVDPSGNIRRGASAALQELIGRHPNTIAEGIPLVQVVDYHAVARRSRAMNEIAGATAALSHHYWSPLVEALMQWRGIGSPDAESRRQAARAIGGLSAQGSYRTMQQVLERLLARLQGIPHGEVETRHGCFLAIAATVDAFHDQRAKTKTGSEAVAVAGLLDRVWGVFDSPLGPTRDDLTLQSWRPELTAEASACLIYSLSRATSSQAEPRPPPPSATVLDKAREVLLLCISRSEDISIETSSQAISELWPLLSSETQRGILEAWFSHLSTTWNLPTGRGQIAALGAVFRRLPPDSPLRKSVIENLVRCAEKEELIEKRVSAVKSLTSGILPHIDITDSLVNHLVRLLNDYTTDRRGDVGSLVRLEAIQAAGIILPKNSSSSRDQFRDIVGCLCRLAAEKLDKVRIAAWLCLQSFWETAEEFPPLLNKFDHFSHVSTAEYFLQLLSLQQIPWLRTPLFQGLATSAVAGSEGLIRASRAALVRSYCLQQQGYLLALLTDLSRILATNLQDDRYAIPVMEFVGFILDGFEFRDFGDVDGVGLRDVLKDLFVLIQKAHFKSPNLARLEAAVRVYAPLSRVAGDVSGVVPAAAGAVLQKDVRKKMTGLLLHPFPRVRSLTAEYLFMETGAEVVKVEDWTRPNRELKGVVEVVRGVVL
ncbi:tubulin-specific chaperone D [Aspergillus aculeatinus CBS 121060]|uniref:Tubulin-specific chaperone D n=1 Tax=Aspergillus aculeatinus CBS 121060 TaxID=1448322 RepID=A0ACD1H871_9EURO|nr:putative tubulin-specific chaperone D [Aspergillus aculeatinus CBS 121060]RAH69606.1 putative tubulin-specific chaperone D [Aspergillus aculeatinus CBS 121060]